MHTSHLGLLMVSVGGLGYELFDFIDYHNKNISFIFRDYYVFSLIRKIASNCTFQF